MSGARTVQEQCLRVNCKDNDRAMSGKGVQEQATYLKTVRTFPRLVDNSKAEIFIVLSESPRQMLDKRWTRVNQ